MDSEKPCQPQQEENEWFKSFIRKKMSEWCLIYDQSLLRFSTNPGIKDEDLTTPQELGINREVFSFHQMLSDTLFCKGFSF